MSARVVSEPLEPVRRQTMKAPRRGVPWWLWPVAAISIVGRRTLRLWRGGSRTLGRVLGRKLRFKLKVLVAVLLLVSPVWGLNLAVAFLGHSVVFPLSPFFLRQKFAAVVSYARHRSSCWAAAHDDTDREVKRAEGRHHLPRGLLAAVVQVESRGFPHRISFAGAMGPGQLMPDTARELGVKDPFDTAENVEGAARLLAGHLARFHNVRFAVAAYNAGAGAVHGRIPDNGQTPAYVDKVMHAYATLRPRTPAPSRTSPPSRRDAPRPRARVRRGPALAFTEAASSDL